MRGRGQPEPGASFVDLINQSGVLEVGPALVQEGADPLREFATSECHGLRHRLGGKKIVNRTISTVQQHLGQAERSRWPRRQSCHDLWVERNSYYKQAGYCFKTSKAISYFGNGGCIYDIEASVPLPRDIRARIAEITRIERRSGCN